MELTREMMAEIPKTLTNCEVWALVCYILRWVCIVAAFGILGAAHILGNDRWLIWAGCMTAMCNLPLGMIEDRFLGRR